jgi:cation transport ATPase
LRALTALLGRADLLTEHVHALPHDKLDYVMHELEAGRHPLVVGDGLNDVLAIKAGAAGAPRRSTRRSV